MVYELVLFVVWVVKDFFEVFVVVFLVFDEFYICFGVFWWVFEEFLLKGVECVLLLFLFVEDDF